MRGGEGRAREWMIVFIHVVLHFQRNLNETAFEVDR